MEQNTPIIAKKIWNLMRVAFFMLRKGISKRKILLDLKLLMKRGNIAGKALQNLMFHHHHHHHQGSSSGSKPGKDGPSSQLQCFSSPPPGEYEFSCSSTPSYHHFFSNKKKHHNNNNNSSFFTPYSSFEDMDNNIEIVVDKMFDMMKSSEKDNVMASPAVLGLGFGRNSGVRQLRITDSPFPLQNTEDSKHVDAAAEDFIKKFYSQLQNQKYH